MPLETYQRLGAERGVYWSPIAVAVLETLWKCDKPIGAYGIRDRLATEHPRNVNSIYRVLGRLVDVGLVLSITTTRRFLLSRDPLERDWLVLICSSCGQVQTTLLRPTFAKLREQMTGLNFTPRQIYMEVCASNLTCPAPGSGSADCSSSLRCLR